VYFIVEVHADRSYLSLGVVENEVKKGWIRIYSFSYVYGLLVSWVYYLIFRVTPSNSPYKIKYNWYFTFLYWENVFLVSNLIKLEQ
jgi:hypothetical protein